MTFSLHMWTLAASWMAAVPAHPSPPTVLESARCSAVQPSHRVAGAGQGMENACAGTVDSADIWMTVMLMLGGVVVGVPAARRRQGRTVFS